MIWLAIAVGGALGSLARYGVSRVFTTGSSFPWSTFAVNVTGCLLIGLAATTLGDRAAWIRAGLIVGVLGGYTTFSAFGNESFALLDANDVATGLAYAAGSVVVGIMAVWAGVVLGRAF